MVKAKSSLVSPQFFAGASEFLHWLQKKAEEYQVYAIGSNTRLQSFSPPQILSLTFNPFRGLDPLKTIFFPLRTQLSSALEDEPSDEPVIPWGIILGAKSCDLKALKLMDAVFLEGEVQDDDYRSRRERMIIISSDCLEPADYCFCLALSGSVYPEDGFDLNLTVIPEGLVIVSGSQKGQELISQAGFRLATEQEQEAKRNLRKEVEQKFREQLSHFRLEFEGIDLGKLIESKRGAGVWKELAQRCVECAGCSFICPTCHCFLLSDKGKSLRAVRFRTWDSCQYPGFARIAGGLDPLARKEKRIWNRFEKKWIFFKSRLGSYGCVGCGRCIEACLARLDLREILKGFSYG